MILLLACSDPQLDPVREALEAYDLGRAALDAGEAAQAAAVKLANSTDNNIVFFIGLLS